MKTEPIAIVLIVLATALTSTGQILFKMASEKFGLSIAGTIGNGALISGLAVYLLASLLLLLSLQRGELSVIYPIIATGFVWVSLFSVILFNEMLNIFKIGGVVFIIIGITLISFGRA